MNKMLAISKRFSWISLIILLVACGTVPTPQSITPSPTSRPTSTPVPSTSTASPTGTFAPTPSPTSLPKFPLSGYAIIFVKNGDLYFQDGNNLPVKLTHVGEKLNYHPLLSDDNQKIVFYRADGNEYSINTDGTDEQAILTEITPDWFTPFGPGLNKGILGFIPDTHQLLFQTYLCKSQESWPTCSVSIFLVDTDTSAIKKLADLGLFLQQLSVPRNIKISPDGKMIAIGTPDHVDIINTHGTVIHHNILPYKPSQNTLLFPALFWLPDSSGLIVALPNTFYNSRAHHDFPASTIWRYSIEDNIAVQIRFDPAPMHYTFQVSPDAKWIVYGGLDGADQSVYLGNLAKGHVQIVGDAVQVYFSWGPDSQYFIGTSVSSWLGSIDTPGLTRVCGPYEWVDSSHFTCFRDQKLHIAEIGAEKVEIYDLGLGNDADTVLLIKPR